MFLVLLLLFILSLFRLSLKNKSSPFSSLPFLLVTGCPDACLGQEDTAAFYFTIWHRPALQIF